MGFDRTQTFSIEPVCKITLKSPSLFLSVFAENITTLKPETTPEEHSRWVREGLVLWRSIEDFGERVFLAWCEWDHARETGAEKRGSKWRQQMEAQRQESSYRGGEAPGRFCGWHHHSQTGQLAHPPFFYLLLSFGTAATAVSGSIGVMALILLLLGLLSLALKKWRHESESNELSQELEM